MECGNCKKEFSTLELFIKHSCKLKKQKQKKECTRCGEKGHEHESCYRTHDISGFPIENEFNQ